MSEDIMQKSDGGIILPDTSLTVETSEPVPEMHPGTNPLENASRQQVEDLMGIAMGIANTSKDKFILWVMASCTVYSCWRELDSRDRCAENNKYAGIPEKAGREVGDGDTEKVKFKKSY